MTYTETEVDGLTQKYFFSGYEAGKKDERERIKQIVQDWFDYDGDTSEGSKNLLEWIDEELINE